MENQAQLKVVEGDNVTPKPMDYRSMGELTGRQSTAEVTKRTPPQFGVELNTNDSWGKLKSILRSLSGGVK